MTTYILRRLAQAIPQLFIISLILFVLMQSFGDPIATLGGRIPPRPEDKERLRRQMGLDQPVYMQYITWLVGNDWQKIDMDDDDFSCDHQEQSIRQPFTDHRQHRLTRDQ